MPEIDITKPVWTRSGQRVMELEVQHGPNGDYLNGIATYNNWQTTWSWELTGEMSGIDSDSMHLTNTPPATSSPVEEKPAFEVAADIEATTTVISGQTGSTAFALEIASLRKELAAKDEPISHLEREVERMHERYQVLFQIYKKIDRRAKR